MRGSNASSEQDTCMVRLDGEVYRVVLSSKEPRVKGRVLLIAEVPASMVASREHACTAAAEMLLNARRGRRVARNPYLNLLAFLLGVRSIAKIVQLVEELRGAEKVYIAIVSGDAAVEGVEEPRLDPTRYIELLRHAGEKPPSLRGEAAARYASTRTAAFSINLKL